MSSKLITLRGVVIQANKYHGTGKGFGYAFVGLTGNPDYPRVFIHANGCRRVEGTSREPVLTRDKATAPNLTADGDATRVIMVARQGERGPEAVYWGVIPETDYIAAYVKSGALDKYIGGQIGVNVNHHHSWGTGWVDGMLEGFEFEAGVLTLRIYRFKSDGSHDVNDYYTEYPCHYETRGGNAGGEPPNMATIELRSGMARIVIYLHPPHPSDQ